MTLSLPVQPLFYIGNTEALGFQGFGLVDLQLALLESPPYQPFVPHWEQASEVRLAETQGFIYWDSLPGVSLRVALGSVCEAFATFSLHFRKIVQMKSNNSL